MNLYLDDVRNPPDDSWTLVRTAEEARTIIASGVVECASLDHDLGECEECTAKSTMPGSSTPIRAATA